MRPLRHATGAAEVGRVEIFPLALAADTSDNTVADFAAER